MIAFMLASALAQSVASMPDPCHAATPASTANCPAWRALHQDVGGALFADPASLRRDGTGFEIRLRFVYAEAGADVIRSIVTGFRFDCAARTVAIGRGHAYDAGGSQLDEEEPNEGYTDPVPVADDAREAAVLTAYCTR